MNARRQYRVLYRDFLFRIVDRELLSFHAKGDASQLLLQVLTLLLGVSVLLSLPALFIDLHVHLMYAGHPNPRDWFETYTPQFERVVMPASAEQLLMAGVTSARDLVPRVTGGQPMFELVGLRL